MWPNSRLLLFTRYPKAGKTKTRLIADLGADGAAMLQKRLTERVLVQIILLKKRFDIATIVHYSEGNTETMTSWLGPMDYVTQVSGDLGQRMHAAFSHAFDGGAENVILIGSDIPDITADLLQQAFTSLLTKEVVIGPSKDGGYYLIGMVAKKASQLLPMLFHEMPWSTKELFATTLNRLDTAGYNVAVLPALRDIDVPADLPFARTRGLL